MTSEFLCNVALLILNKIDPNTPLQRQYQNFDLTQQRHFADNKVHFPTLCLPDFPMFYPRFNYPLSGGRAETAWEMLKQEK